MTTQSRSPQCSSVITTHIVLPTHTNALGTIFGGTVASWIDIAAAISAMKYAQSEVVTASIDALHFIEPIRLGDVVTIKAIVNFVSRTSMEVGVRVESEELSTGTIVHNCSAYTTFVALDKNRKPREIPKLDPKSDDENQRFEEAKKRKEARQKLAKEIKAGRN